MTRRLSRRNIVESLIISWLFPLVITRLVSRLLSISTYSPSFKDDIQLFISTPINNLNQLNSTLFIKIEQLIKIETDYHLIKFPDWLIKSLTVFLVTSYASFKSIYFTFAMIFTLLCFTLTMKRKLGGFNALITAIIGQ